MTSFLRTSVIVFEIAACQAAVASNRPDALLARLGESATRFWDQFSAMTCTETVDQKKLEPGGKVIVQRKSAYDYLILMQLSGDELTVEESRLLRGQAAQGDGSGATRHQRLLHHAAGAAPHFRASYDFAEAPDREEDGPPPQ